MAADMVGFSRLMEADEAGTLAVLKVCRGEIIDPRISDYNGRIVKTTGDGIIAEFASVVDAVQSGIDIQRAMAKRNAGMPDAKRIDFRIGINLGDIIIDDDDIFGDGVNIAARIEALAEPGTLCITSAVYDQVKKKVDAEYEDIGAPTLKNITERIRVFQVWPSGTRAKEDVAADTNDIELADGTDHHPLTQWTGLASAALVVGGIVVIVLVYLIR